MDHGGVQEELAAGHGLRSLLRFIGGETNQWYPDLAEDNYHLSKDLADKALEFIRDTKQSEPDKPWYLWFCPGANHAPHHAAQEYIDKYKGRFDDGYGAYREWVLPRMIERGILPEGTELTPINPMAEGTFTPGDLVRPWDSLSEEEKRLFSRMAVVYAGFSEYTDAQGGIIDYLEQSGQLDNTIVLYCADNGASGEGSPNGSVNENKIFNGYPDRIEDNLPLIDRLGSPATYNHYPTGWAVAFSTPYRMFMRYCYQGGVCDPLVISWPAGFRARGEVRHQYHHSTDIVPTILDVCGVEMPTFVNGRADSPARSLDALQLRRRTRRPNQEGDPVRRDARGPWSLAQGRKVVTEHGPMAGTGHVVRGGREVQRPPVEQLPHVGPGVAGVLRPPIPRCGAQDRDLHLLSRHLGGARALGRQHPPRVVPDPGRSRARRPDAQGVIIAQGSRFGGHAMFIKDGTLTYTYNFLGIGEEQRFSTDVPEPGRRRRPDEDPAHPVLAVRGGLCVGYDGGDAVSREYRPTFPFTGGTIAMVTFDVADETYQDIQTRLAALMARD